MNISVFESKKGTGWFEQDVNAVAEFVAID